MSHAPEPFAEVVSIDQARQRLRPDTVRRSILPETLCRLLDSNPDGTPRPPRDPRSGDVFAIVNATRED